MAGRFQELAPYLIPTFESVVIALSRGELLHALIFMKAAGRSFSELSVLESENLLGKGIFTSALPNLERTHLASFLIFSEGWRPVGELFVLLEALDFDVHARSVLKREQYEACEYCRGGRLNFGSRRPDACGVVSEMNLSAQEVKGAIFKCLRNGKVRALRSILEAARQGGRLSFEDLADSGGEDHIFHTMAKASGDSAWLASGNVSVGHASSPPVFQLVEMLGPEGSATGGLLVQS